MAGIVQELVVQIVCRIGIVIVEVKPLGNEQTSGIRKVGVRREASVGMTHCNARAWLPVLEQPPGADDIGVLKTPLEVTGSAWMIASACGAGWRRLLDVCDRVLEQRLRVDDLRLRAEAIYGIPRLTGRDSLCALWRHELELALIRGNCVHAPAREPGF